MKVQFSPPDISQSEIDGVIEVLKSGWITTGPKTKEFERKIAQYCGVNKAVCLNSQTACAEMALRVLGLTKDDEVITTAYTYTASASVVAHIGAKLVLVDTKENSLEMDYDKLEDKITEKTKAIIPVDIAGVPCDYNRLFEIAEAKKSLFKPCGKIQEAIGRIAIMADAAHSFGAEYHGKKSGSIADFSSFSFHAVKNLTTAEGGALTWNEIDGIDDEEIYKKLQLLSLHGQSKDAFSKTTVGAWEYDVLGAYYKCNMTDITAAIGIAQLKRYNDMLLRRKDIIKKYDAALKTLGISVLKHYSDDYSSSGHLYITRLPHISLEDRNEIITAMAKRDIACNVHYKPLPLLTAYKNMGFDINDFPNAYNFYKNEITLPLHTCLTDEMISYVIDNFVECIKKFI